MVSNLYHFTTYLLGQKVTLQYICAYYFWIDMARGMGNVECSGILDCLRQIDSHGIEKAIASQDCEVKILKTKLQLLGPILI